MKKKSPILITGGAGYIGSHTCEAFLNQGYEVIVYDNLSTGFREAIPSGVEFVEGDILDTNKMILTLKKYKIESVAHLAAKLVVEESSIFPQEYYETNVGGTISVAKACTLSNVQNILFSSTASVYGNPEIPQKLISEDIKTNPINPYGKSKLWAEAILKDVAESHKMNLIILRYFNVAGASFKKHNGLRSKKATHLIKRSCLAALNLIDSIHVYGNDYPTPDGTCIRDYIHIEDLAEIHVHSLNYLLENNCNEVFNCGYGKGFSVLEVLREIKKISQNEFPVKIDARRSGDPVCLVSNTEKINKILKWTPKHNNLKEICQSALEWEKKFNNK